MPAMEGLSDHTYPSFYPWTVQFMLRYIYFSSRHDAVGSVGQHRFGIPKELRPLITPRSRTRVCVGSRDPPTGVWDDGVLGYEYIRVLECPPCPLSSMAQSGNPFSYTERSLLLTPSTLRSLVRRPPTMQPLVKARPCLPIPQH